MDTTSEGPMVDVCEVRKLIAPRVVSSYALNIPEAQGGRPGNFRALLALLLAGLVVGEGAMLVSCADVPEGDDDSSGVADTSVPGDDDGSNETGTPSPMYTIQCDDGNVIVLPNSAYQGLKNMAGVDGSIEPVSCAVVSDTNERLQGVQAEVPMGHALNIVGSLFSANGGGVQSTSGEPCDTTQGDFSCQVEKDGIPGSALISCQETVCDTFYVEAGGDMSARVDLSTGVSCEDLKGGVGFVLGMEVEDEHGQNISTEERQGGICGNQEFIQ
ncbi:MAG: hypothetical protein UR28_C0001G0043 [Candidatus Peregrinibacteria bacterium GW2011_GWF2_33_10]|nr:MAG: hypothetical protein UR28_C0001G0043 [Candidatus Peregrinibacteria bacterium GW2011_GWF2_33_10]OGJ44791.1 MAG: hypothetical protein A2263_06150 [Candidatus Peregrinibacteria bacterium RIFOXYA2_FULL_33_21]OGJ46553.1 MAG: hypothetical protein A2272_01540 [Candidatus Peregrinibacteria bacterium RIFOXYA12_FULL_33_12]OGJ50477.1 MAG: hypothetical protein A2307_02775 [Candidatus Peregrinibacteria bacterium RIFOXYB2_FULL_33_20]